MSQRLPGRAHICWCTYLWNILYLSTFRAIGRYSYNLQWTVNGNSYYVIYLITWSSKNLIDLWLPGSVPDVLNSKHSLSDSEVTHFTSRSLCSCTFYPPSRSSKRIKSALLICAQIRITNWGRATANDARAGIKRSFSRPSYIVKHWYTNPIHYRARAVP